MEREKWDAYEARNITAYAAETARAERLVAELRKSLELTEATVRMLRSRSAEIRAALDDLHSVMCDPQHRVCVSGSEEDIHIMQLALDTIHNALQLQG
jgi:hypothetical protein